MNELDKRRVVFERIPLPVRLQRGRDGAIVYKGLTPLTFRHPQVYAMMRWWEFDGDAVPGRRDGIRPHGHAQCQHYCRSDGSRLNEYVDSPFADTDLDPGTWLGMFIWWHRRPRPTQSVLAKKLNLSRETIRRWLFLKRTSNPWHLPIDLANEASFFGQTFGCDTTFRFADPASRRGSLELPELSIIVRQLDTRPTRYVRRSRRRR